SILQICQESRRIPRPARARATLLPECIPPRLDDLDAHPGWCAASPACQRHAVIDPHVIAVAPSQFLQCLQERRHAPALFPIVFSEARKHADAWLVLELLRLRGQRPSGRTTEKGDKLAPSHCLPRHSRSTIVRPLRRASSVQDADDK